MKSILSTGIFAALIGWITTDNVGAFVGVRRYSNPTPIAERLTLAAAASVALEPEPLGGKELTCRTSIADCRLKQLNTPSTVKTDGSYQFWLTAKAEGKLIEEIRATILRDASKKANFPGFRKGQVPPFAQPQITQFAVQEAIIKTVEAAVSAYGLQSLPGSDGEVKVHEDVASMAKAYKTGNSVQFTATLNASYNADKITTSTDEKVFDVAAAVVDDLAAAEKESS